MELQERIDSLRARVVPIEPTDTMSEAARKALLSDLIWMLENEAGSRTGEAIKHVHDMRVATRRMRSILLLLGAYFKPRSVQGFQRQLQRLGQTLGGVRDLDVMIDNLTRFKAALPDEQQAALQGVIDMLDAQRAGARKRLVKLLDKRNTTRFIESFGEFLTTGGAGARQPQPKEDEAVPVEVRHVLPVEIYRHLAAVRAYDSALDNASIETLHALRIEFKKLRYLLTMVGNLLGKNGKEFVAELKAIQDHLGNLNDAVVAQAALRDLTLQLDDAQAAALELYINTLSAEEERLMSSFPEMWERFNSPKTQRLLATAIAGL